ncbi:MAG: dihydrofolate reductase family protein [Gemmatimonadaceae bacterium]
MKASTFIATSLDGYIARLDGALDWLPESPEEHGYTEFIDSADVIVIGRKTFDTVMSFGGWPYGDKQVVVLSSRAGELRAPDGAKCEFMSGTPHEIVAHLSGRGFQHAYVDGGATVTKFLEAGLLQRMIVTRIPVLIGSGIPLFGEMSRDIRFEHVRTQSYKSGLVQSEYVISNGGVVVDREHHAKSCGTASENRP